MKKFVVRYKDLKLRHYLEKVPMDRMLVAAESETEAIRHVRSEIMGHEVEIIDCVEEGKVRLRGYKNDKMF